MKVYLIHLKLSDGLLISSRYCTFQWTAITWVSLSVYMSSHVRLCVCVCLWGVKLCWVTRACVLSHLDLFGPNKRGPVSAWAVGPQSHEQKVPPHNLHLSSSQPGTNLFLSLSPSVQPLLSLSFTTLCILATSLPGHGLAYFYLSHSGPFDVDYVGPFHRSCVCLEMAPLLKPQSVYEYTFHKQDMQLMVYKEKHSLSCISCAYHSKWC